MTCSHKVMRIATFAFRGYIVGGRVCIQCGKRLFNEPDLDRIPVDELKLGFLTEVKEI